MSGAEMSIESQLAEAAFPESEEHYRAVAEAATDAIITIDSESTILVVNPASERIFGYSTAEMIGQPLTMLMPEYLRHLHKAGITRYLETGRLPQSVLRSFTLDALGDDRRHRFESLDGVPFQRLSSKHRDNANRSAFHRVMTVGELTASIAHEINQPLAAIVMNGNAALRWLAFDPPNLAKARDSAELIIRDGERASQVIARIRALLKKSPPSKTLLDVNEFVNEVVDLTQSEMVRNSVSLRVEFADDLPKVSGDRIQLQQVLLNLMVNSVEAMLPFEDRQRELLIATDVFDNTGVRVAVSDNGLGIDPQTADHLFDAFSTTKPDGMGMGLAISRLIIEAHGGRLWTEPNNKYGATFQFTLPIVANES